jgi:GxxExxY protein
VHRVLGPGLLESVYERCLRYELKLREIEHQRQVALPVVYKGVPIDADLYREVAVQGQLVLGLKAVEALHPIHETQLLTYLKLSGIHRGLLLNFNVRLLKDGIKRLVV